MKSQILLAGAVALGVSACSSVGLAPPSPPNTPTIADISAQQDAVSAFKGQPADVLNIGVGLSNGWCTAYLNALTTNASLTDFEAGTATQLGTLTTGIAGAAGASAMTTAIASLVFPTANQTLMSAGRMATAGADPGMVFGLVQRQQAAFLGALTPPSSAQEALTDVSAYAAYCQPAGIRSAVLQAGINAQATANSAAPGAAKALAPMGNPATRVNAPPVVTVGR